VWVGYGVIVAVLPYLALKVLWVSGVMIGVPEGSPAAGPGFVGPNVVTGAMDVVAIVVALALTQPWGMRLPAWLILPPAWVGTGLLVPAVVEVLNGAAAAAVTGGRAVTLDGGLVEPWAYVLVYAWLALQGLLLSAAFPLYARARWARLFRPEAAGAGPGPAYPLEHVLAAGGAVAAGAVALGHLVMAFGAQGAFVNGYQDGWEYTARSAEVVNAAMAACAAAGIWLVRRRSGDGRAPRWAGIGLTWFGTGAMFGYALLTLLAIAAGVPESDNVSPLNRLTQLCALLAGLTIALAGVLRLVERAAGRPTLGSTP
jgi:hypothetical protein